MKFVEKQFEKKKNIFFGQNTLYFLFIYLFLFLFFALISFL